MVLPDLERQAYGPSNRAICDSLSSIVQTIEHRTTPVLTTQQKRFKKAGLLTTC